MCMGVLACIVKDLRDIYVECWQDEDSFGPMIATSDCSISGVDASMCCVWLVSVGCKF
jgi:hypothetical protein